MIDLNLGLIELITSFQSLNQLQQEKCSNIYENTLESSYGEAPYLQFIYQISKGPSQ